MCWGERKVVLEQCAELIGQTSGGSSAFGVSPSRAVLAGESLGLCESLSRISSPLDDGVAADETV